MVAPVLHGHGCGCRCPTRVRVSDSLEFLGTRQITLGIRYGCRVSDSAKKLRHECPGNIGSHWPSVKSIPLVRLCGRLVGILAFFLLI